jgi:hypothetical protein
LVNKSFSSFSCNVVGMRIEFCTGKNKELVVDLQNISTIFYYPFTISGLSAIIWQ